MGKRYDELLGQQLVKDNGQFVHGFLSSLFAADNGGHGVGQFVVHLAPGRHRRPSLGRLKASMKGA